MKIFFKCFFVLWLVVGLIKLSLPWYLDFLFILGIVFMLISIYSSLTAKYVSPYTLDIFFGRKGCGKSSTLQRLAAKYNKLGWKCYCDEGNTMQPFVIPIDAKHIYQYRFPSNSVVFIDEINLLWDNRKFKDFPDGLQYFLRMQRHKKIKLIMFSQTYDCDLKIRNLADRLYICNKFARVFTFCKAYVKCPVVLTSEQTTTEARISDDFKPLPFWCNTFTFIPRWVKKYDSFRDEDPYVIKDAPIVQCVFDLVNQD